MSNFPSSPCNTRWRNAIHHCKVSKSLGGACGLFDVLLGWLHVRVCMFWVAMGFHSGHWLMLMLKHRMLFLAFCSGSLLFWWREFNLIVLLTFFLDAQQRIQFTDLTGFVKLHYPNVRQVDEPGRFWKDLLYESALMCAGIPWVGLHGSQLDSFHDISPSSSCTIRSASPVDPS